eukprot:TRINITY_DN43815_c0_g1_i1.p1 TRINITY_DN43815_c0_g1~~TRINITY_DN43815_c0_g1_i1.p1  ORF type:complete len:342 (+),score=70.17 TRINITY_DN43815_c0_g1_i1:72-1097(+)
MPGGAHHSTLFAEASLKRSDAGDFNYWQNLAKTYDEDIFITSEADDKGVIRGELDAAARLAAGGDSASSAGQGQCAANFPHGDIARGQGLLAVDAGCGPGKWLPALSSRFSRVVGVDQSPKLIAKARADNAEFLAGAHGNVELRQAVDLGSPCKMEKGVHGKEFCGPEVQGLRQAADLVASFNVLISPQERVRAQILRREAEMLRPSPHSTLLLLVPSAESMRRVRDLYRGRGGPESGLGVYEDYIASNPEDEAKNVFPITARTQHYTKEEACAMVEAVGLTCDKVKKYPVPWKFIYPDISEEDQEKLKHQPSAHEWIVVAHPRAANAAPPVLSNSRADFL